MGGHGMSDDAEIIESRTGGRKGRKRAEYAAIPVGALDALAKVYGYGMSKYPDDDEGANWRKGYDYSLAYSALQRHLNAFWRGEDTDPESGLPHLAHAAWHCFTLMTFVSDAHYAEFDDRADKRAELESAYVSVFSEGRWKRLDLIDDTGADERSY